MKNINKYIKIILTILIFSLFFSPAVLAVDLEVDCPAPPTACIKSGTDPLFSTILDGFWYPGRILTKTVSLKNTSPERREMAIKGVRTSTQGDLENVLHLAIATGGIVIWSGSVSDFYNQEKIGMGIFDPGALLSNDFTVSLNSDIDDQYKDKQTVFDLTLGFWGEPILTPTAVPTGQTTADVSASVCNDSKPGTPTNFSVFAGAVSGQVMLSWTPPAGSFTYFLIAYSDNENSPKWGNPNIGNVSSFAVSGLGGGTYWFWLRAGNGCMPGDFTGPIKIVLGGETKTALLSGFTPILGVKTPGEIGRTIATGSSQGRLTGLFDFLLKLWHRLLIFLLLLKARIGGMIF